MPATVHTLNAPATKTAKGYTPNNKFNKPLPKKHRNFVPAQSWLAYNFVDKDPELDFVCWAIEQSGMTIEQIVAECEKAGHPIGKYTIYGWLYRGTKKPQNYTMNTVMSVLGFERQWKERGH